MIVGHLPSSSDLEKVRLFIESLEREGVDPNKIVFNEDTHVVEVDGYVSNNLLIEMRNRGFTFDFERRFLEHTMEEWTTFTPIDVKVDKF